MAAPTVYKWTDAGAPQVHRQNTAQVAEYQAIFQACLIDGYGDKLPPSGGLNKWSIPFSSTGGFILKQGGTSERKLSLKLHNFYSTGMHADAFVAEDFTDYNTPVNVLTEATSSDRVGFGQGNLVNYEVPWIIIATERAIYCQFGYNNTGQSSSMFDSTGGSAMYNAHWFFGDYKPADPTLTVNQMLCAPNVSPSQVNYYCYNFLNNNSTSSYGKKVLCGNHLNISTLTRMTTLRLIDSSSNSAHIGSNNGVYPSYPDPLTGGLYLDRLRIMANRCVMGEFPGLLYPIQSSPLPIYGQVLEIDGSGDYLGEKLYCFGDYSGGQYFIRDGDWGVE